MLVYLDSNIVIYLIESFPGWSERAEARMLELRAARARLAVSDLTRMECRVAPLRRGDADLIRQYDDFFADPDVQTLPLPATVFDRAAEIRARYRFSTPDAPHLAAALAGGCDSFLTNDNRLAAFADLAVEVLP